MRLSRSGGVATGSEAVAVDNACVDDQTGGRGHIDNAIANPIEMSGARRIGPDQLEDIRGDGGRLAEDGLQLSEALGTEPCRVRCQVSFHPERRRRKRKEQVRGTRPGSVPAAVRMFQTTSSSSNRVPLLNRPRLLTHGVLVVDEEVGSLGEVVERSPVALLLLYPGVLLVH